MTTPRANPTTPPATPMPDATPTPDAPASPDAPAGGAAPGASAAPGVDDVPGGGGGAAPATRILHVDDDEANRYAVTRTLVKAGFEVVEAADGRTALERAARAHPDLIILDVRLPDLSGFEVCRRLKTDPVTARVPVLHLSASYVSPDDKAHGLNTGADGYLVRPVAPGELLATINALLRVRRSEDALRASEERFRAAFADAAVGMVLCDLRGRIVQANDAAQRITGRDAAALARLDLRAITHPEDREATDRLVRQMIDEHVPSFSLEKRYLRPDGSAVWAQDSVSLARDPAGRPASLIVLAQDITERRRAQAGLRAARDEADAARVNAETANRLKDEFLAVLSHELRTPLTAIIGWASLLRRGGTLSAADRDEGLQTIERNAKVQAQLIEDLLDVSRIISGKLRLDLQPLPLAAVVDAALAAVKLAADARRIALVRDADADAAARRLEINGDPGRLQQVLSNLLTNAVKFSPEGSTVTIRVRRDDAPATGGSASGSAGGSTGGTASGGPSAVIDVLDNGRGIDAAFLPYVFERFRQADASTKRAQGGLGLGLAIVRQLVELHGGSVGVHSDGPGRGARFTVRLPLRPAVPPVAPDARDASDARAARADGHGHDGGHSGAFAAAVDVTPVEDVLAGTSILVVEDDLDCRALAEHVLRSVGADVVAEPTVSGAMAQLRRRRFDLVISDIGMPDEDGFDLIRQLRALGPEQGGRTPAAALSAFAQTAARQRMIDSGFAEPIAKPVDPTELVAAARRLVGR